VSGIGALYPEFGGWAWGGATVGATNAWLSGANSFSNIAMGAATGIVSSVVGGAVGTWASNSIGNVLINGFNITNPIVKGAIGGVIGGAAGGYAGGFIGGYITTGDIQAANKAGLNGLWMGAAIGTVSGSIGGYRAATKAGLNPWMGKAKNSITIGEGMNSNVEKGWLGIDKIAMDLGSSKFEPSQVPVENWNTDGTLMQENALWIELKIQEQVIIYDRGTVGNNSQYYNMEVGRTMNYNNIYTVKAIYNQTQTIRLLLIY
jgi:hypothetical protein